MSHTTVSYTHLGGSHSSSHSSSPGSAAVQSSFLSGGLAGAVGTVSYTHLDVYKRQLPMILWRISFRKIL